MRFAAFETSSEWCSVALYIDGEVRAIERRAGQRHSELALPMFSALLQNTGLKPGDLAAIAFGAGPGSFTGLRIACGIAQGLAFAHSLPVLGISAFEAIAHASHAARVVVCIDARMREVYYAALEKHDALWREVIAPQCISPNELPRPQGEGWIGCGSGFAAYGNLGFASVFPELHASASAIAELAAPRFARGEGVDPAAAAPFYVRDKVAYTRAELEKRR